MNLKLEELEVYQLAEKIADSVWEICVSMENFARDSIGKQFVRAADSIGANIAEDYGRYSFKENIQFFYYARGSLMETRHFLNRAKNRKLLTVDQDSELVTFFDIIAPKLNAYIKSIKSQVTKPLHI